MRTKAIAVIMTFFVCGLYLIRAQEISPCFCVPSGVDPVHHYDWFNSDSIAVDTCGYSSSYTNCETLALFLIADKQRVYARKNFYFSFDIDAIKLPALSPDSIVIVTWHDIDTNYPEIRTALEQIEKDFSPFTLRKAHPEYTSGYDGQSFFLTFTSYGVLDNILQAFDTIPHVTLYPSAMGFREVSVGEEYADYPFTITPNPVSDYIRIRRQKGSPYSDKTDRIVLWDIHGRIALSSYFPDHEESAILPVGHIPEGMYILQYHTSFQPLIIMR